MWATFRTKLYNDHDRPGLQPACSPPPMTRTRKQSKAAAAAAVETDTAEPSPAPLSQQTQSQAELHLAIPDDINLDVLSTLLPDAQLDAPSADTIVTLYRLVLAQASDSDLLHRELEETKAELQRKDVELDQALQDRESAVRELETVSDSLQNELNQARQEKEEIRMSSVSRAVDLLTYVLLYQSRPRSRWGLN